jgi:hypothetical protein
MEVESTMVTQQYDSDNYKNTFWKKKKLRFEKDAVMLYEYNYWFIVKLR